MKRALGIGLIVALLVGCKPAQEVERAPKAGNQFATQFELRHEPDYCLAIVYNPFQGGELKRYYLVKDEHTETPQDGIRLQVPLQRVATSSCTQVGFIQAFDQLKTIVGVCNPDLIFTPLPQTPQDLGDGTNINVEQVLLAHPQALFFSAYNGSDTQNGLLQEAGIAVVFENEWTETSPLARAEWMRFVGAFYDQEAQADSLFEEVKKQYESWQAVAQSCAQRYGEPTLMTGSNFRGTWYMPSADNYMAGLFQDAGADYFYAQTHGQTSLPLSEEQVLLHFEQAEVWVGCDVRTYAELLQQEPKHGLFHAFQQRRVYNFLARTTPTGGNDFWETGAVRPDWILEDLIRILYPLAPNLGQTDSQDHDTVPPLHFIQALQ